MYPRATFPINPTTGTPGTIFTGSYTGIFRANQVIAQARAATSTSADGRKRYAAEAQFVCGLHYLLAATNFGAQLPEAALLG